MVGLLLWFPHYNTLQLYRYIPSNDSFSMLENHHFIPPHPHPGVLVAGAVADGRHAFQGCLLHLLFDVAGQVRHGTHQVH